MDNIFKKIQTYFLVIVIGALLVIGYFKNNKITKLEAELLKSPKIEFVYRHQIDTIKGDSIPVPYEVIKWKPSDPVEVEVIKYVDPEEVDSAKIAEEYFKVYSDYASIKNYNKVLKDDSLAYIRLKESVQYNSIFGRELIYEHRTPTVVITQPPKHIYTTSIVGGIEAGLGGVDVGIGIITKKNMFLKVSYDPYNGVTEFGGYFPIFNFRK
jgi:hypothetical protein